MKHKKLLFILTPILTLLIVAVAYASYLHVSYAQNYARYHVFKTFCNSSYSTCPTYPWATGWYQRINNNYVRVEIAVRKSGTAGTCRRVFAVRGYDGAEYITSDGSSPYYYCN